MATRKFEEIVMYKGYKAFGIYLVLMFSFGEL